MAGFWLLVSSHTLSEFGSEDQAEGIAMFVAVLAAPVLSLRHHVLAAFGSSA
jgi:hypothetical protein